MEKLFYEGLNFVLYYLPETRLREISDDDLFSFEARLVIFDKCGSKSYPCILYVYTRDDDEIFDWYIEAKTIEVYFEEASGGMIAKVVARGEK